jgi:cell division protein FtsB
VSSFLENVLRVLLAAVFGLLAWALARIVKGYDSRLTTLESDVANQTEALRRSIDFLRRYVHTARSADSYEKRAMALEMVQRFIDHWRDEAFPLGSKLRRHGREDRGLEE